MNPLLAGAVILGTFNLLDTPTDLLDNFSDRLNGTSVSDTIIGDAYDPLSPDTEGDIIQGREGPDVIYGDTGPVGKYPDPNWATTTVGSSDTVYGGPGRDRIYGGSNTDYLYGDEDADTLWGMDGNDVLHGGDGPDVLHGQRDSDVLWGGLGDDTGNGGDDDDTLYGYAISGPGAADRGRDTLRGQGGADKIYGGLGADDLMGGDGDDLLDGNGTFLAGDVGDLLDGGDGKDTLRGGDGDDRLDGGRGADDMTGGADDDTYIVDSTGDKVLEFVNGGRDTVRSSVSFTLPFAFEALVLTGPRAIRGTGNADANDIIGNAAANALSGLAGTDLLDGRGGADTLRGGPDGDRFRFSVSPSTGVDMIADFAVSEDRILLSRAVFKALRKGPLAASAFATVSSTSAIGTRTRVFFIPANRTLLYDPDGKGGKPAVAVARFPAGSPAPRLTAAHVRVVD